MPTLPPLTLYVHVPWCVRKCPYCDFNSHERPTDTDLPEQDYLQALLTDLDQDRHWVQGRNIDAIFIGGGTPSLMSADFYAALFAGLRRRVTFSDDIEITLEANPGALESGRFAGFRAAGINRLSIGVQSFNATHLAALGRIHGPQAAIDAAADARDAGFDNFNLDIMHALPHQSSAQALDDLRQAMALSPSHLSWYELTIEPNTAFFRAPPEQPDGDSRADLEEQGLALLEANGFRRYEVSAFAQPGRECRHNLNYWRFGDYLAIGAGAHGKITLRDPPQRLRYQKTRMPKDYLAQAGHARRALNAIEEPLLEALMNGLRLVDGLPTQVLAQRTGLTRTAINSALAASRQQGLLIQTEDQVACTDLGLRHLNTVLARIVE